MPGPMPTRRPVLVDASRLLSRQAETAPTGIDRVELAYLHHFVGSGSGPGRAFAMTPFGGRLLPPRSAARAIRTTRARWSSPDGRTGEGPAELHRWLGHAEPAAASPAGPPRPKRTVAENLSTADMIRWPGTREVPRGAVYLHVSQFRLDRPPLFAWLRRRPDIRPVFLVHDLIPIDHPEYCRPGEAERHRRRLETVAAHAAAILTVSRSVAARVEAFFSEQGWTPPRLVVAPNGIEETFGPGAPPLAASRPYFVLCGTIEGRKNHLLILQVWRDLVRRLGAATPALVLVGRRGWECEAAIDLLDRCEAILPHVREIGSLPNGELIRLLAGARALLMPSFAEGYGLPVAEALSLGTPVIASDIPAHAEVSRGEATLVDPVDGLGWRDAILAALTDGAGRRVPNGFARPTWQDHFGSVARLIDGL